LICLSLSGGSEAISADISAGRDSNGNNIIILRGAIETGDAVKIEKLKKERIFYAIDLNSPGGNYIEALRIVDVMYPPIATFIDKGAECYSACAIIFMAGKAGGGSGGTYANRRLHYFGKLGFHAPYLSNVTGQFSGEAVQEAYGAAVMSMRELMKRQIIPQSLLTEMLAKEPDDAFFVDTVDKAGRWDIQVVGFRERPITKKMFCTACESHMSWKYDASSHASRCGVTGTTNDDGDGFHMRQSGSDYLIRILFRLPRDVSTECKIRVSPGSVSFNDMPFVAAAFGPPGRDLESGDIDRFLIYPFHYFDGSTLLRDMDR
jgi:hypothetical protein